jgi:hypothetical protein
MRKNLPSNPIQPYTFPGWMMMKPGTLLMGFAIDRYSAKPASEWYIADPNRLEIIQRKGIFSVNVISESTMRWRQRLREFKKSVAQVAVYIRTRNELEEDLVQHPHHMHIDFKYELPIGIFLGHIIRANGVSDVNVMTPEGFDVWL